MYFIIIMRSGLQCIYMYSLCFCRDAVFVLFLQGFGQADHKVTKDIVSRQFNYPDGNITWSNAGY